MRSSAGSPRPLGRLPRLSFGLDLRSYESCVFGFGIPVSGGYTWIDSGIYLPKLLIRFCWRGQLVATLGSTRGSDLPELLLIRFCWRGQLLVDYFAGCDGEGELFCPDIVGLSAGQVWQRIVTLAVEESATVWSRLEIMFLCWPWRLLRSDGPTLAAFMAELECRLAIY